MKRLPLLLFSFLFAFSVAAQDQNDEWDVTQHMGDYQEFLLKPMKVPG